MKKVKKKINLLEVFTLEVGGFSMSRDKEKKFILALCDSLNEAGVKFAMTNNGSLFEFAIDGTFRQLAHVSSIIDALLRRYKLA